MHYFAPILCSLDLIHERTVVALLTVARSGTVVVCRVRSVLVFVFIVE